MVALFASVAFASSDVDHIATDNNVNQDTYVSVDVDKNNDFYYDGDYQVVDTSKMNDYVFVSVDLGRDYDFNCNETVINHEPVNKENDNIDIGFFPGPAPTPIPEEINKTELEKFTKSMPKDNNTEFKKLTEELNLKLAIKELMNKNKNITIKDEKTGFYPRPTPTPIPEEFNKTASEYPNKISIKDIDTELKKLTEELNLKLATKELMNQNEIVPDDESDISEPVAN